MDSSDAPYGSDYIILDLRGLSCPLPVLKTRKAMRGLPLGAIAKILATDPGAEADFRDYCLASGCSFLESRREGEVLSILIRKC
jgi:tRNA 2-thiouridine synthesizing protein A